MGNYRIVSGSSFPILRYRRESLTANICMRLGDAKLLVLAKGKDKNGRKTHLMMDERMRACIQECHNCHDICTETIAHCLQMGGEHAEPSHIRLLLDCAEICQTSANFVLRMSDFHGQTCGVCADVCERCAEDCERFGDDQMKTILQRLE